MKRSYYELWNTIAVLPNKTKTNKVVHTGKLVVVVGPQYLRAAKSYALAALSSLSYPPNFLIKP